MQPTARSAPARVELDRHGADGVREVPEHERAGVVHQPGDRGEVGQRAGAVGDVREDDDGDALVERRGEHAGSRPSSMSAGDLPHASCPAASATPATT